MPIADKRQRRNAAVYLLFSAMYGVGVNICAEGYVQACLLRLGFDTQGIRNYGIAVQACSLLAYLLMTRSRAAQTGLRRINAAAALCLGVLPAALTIAGRVSSFSVIYAVVLCAAALYGFFTAVRAVAEYNMVPYLFDRSLYGPVTGRASVIGGVLPVCISLGAGLLGGRESGALLFPVCMAAFALAALFALLYRLDGGPGQAPPRVTWAGVAKTAASARYRARLLPHLLRGVGMAGMYYIIPSALKNIGLSKSEEAFLIAIPVAATVAGSFLYVLLHKRLGSGSITLASALVCAMLMPVLVALRGKYLFLALYFVFFLFNMVSQLSIPTGVLRSTPNEELTLVSSMRMLLMSAACSLFIFVFGLALQYAAPVWVMVFAGAVFSACGVMFSRQFDDRL